MKNFSLTLVVATVVTLNVSADDRPSPAPTALEAFVARPTVVLDVGEVVGGFESKDASVMVIAIVATDTAHPGVRMTGLRFDLADNAGADRVYLDARELAQLREDLAGIEGGIPELEAEGGAPVRVQGTGACWMPPRPTRILCPSYRVGPDGRGMHLAAYGSRNFSYPGERPAALAALVERALARLEAH